MKNVRCWLHVSLVLWLNCIAQADAATNVDESEDLAVDLLTPDRQSGQCQIPSPVAIIQHDSNFVESLLSGHALRFEQGDEVVVNAEDLRQS